MDDLISRAAAIEEIARRDTTDGTVKVYSGREIIAILSDLPVVDAAPVKRGRWEPSNDYNGYCCCSACHNTYIDPDWLIGGKWQYCPHCGAKNVEE